VNVQEIYPFVALFKGLLTTDSTPPAEEEAQLPLHLARAAKSNDIGQLNDTIVSLVFYNQREWFQQEDSWVAECLAEWADDDAERLFAANLKQDASQTEFEAFVESFRIIADRWREESERARPEPNPEFDPSDPVEGTQFYKYAKLPGTQEFQWLYGTSPETDDWQPMQVRVDAYLLLAEAVDAAAPAEIIEPYGDYFMKAVDGRWQYGATRDSEAWYEDYEQMLRAEGLAPALPGAPAPAATEEEEEDATTESGEVREYGEGFIKLVEGEWHYGAARDAATWYRDYAEMLRAEGLAPEAPASVSETAEVIEELLEPSPEEAEDLGPDGLGGLDEAGDEFVVLFAEALQDPVVAALAERLDDEHRALAAVEIADRASETV
jgi:hypothetical protein